MGGDRVCRRFKRCIAWWWTGATCRQISSLASLSTLTREDYSVGYTWPGIGWLEHIRHVMCRFCLHFCVTTVYLCRLCSHLNIRNNAHGSDVYNCANVLSKVYLQYQCPGPVLFRSMPVPWLLGTGTRYVNSHLRVGNKLNKKVVPFLLEGQV